eukprot:TRINITY_DN46930_c0_g1_i1.p1 TRINITY_DN46930_c0_g1~~TRINITY_DN46930_c0_g1_i1.p1  ORF type:complete len:347 (-),score=73.29 TRINITY_DN46930_c0_g1_i1:204-1244(-)
MAYVARAARGALFRQPPLAAASVNSSLRLCSSHSQCPVFAAAASSAAPPSGGDDAMKGLGEGSDYRRIFQREGLEFNILRMRRCVQAGMALEIIGTQMSNILFHDAMEVYSPFSDMSNFMVMLHCIIVWKYGEFLRDAMLTRHVTGIAVKEAAASSQDAAGTEHHVMVESGPWRRLLLLRPADYPIVESSGPVSSSSSAPVSLPEEPESHEVYDEAPTVDEMDRAPFATLVQTGALHVDRAQATSLDGEALESLMDKSLIVAEEDVRSDVDALKTLHMNRSTLPWSLTNVHRDALQWFVDRPSIHHMLQWSGSRVLDGYSIVVLAMGGGTVILWWPSSRGPRHWLR